MGTGIFFSALAYLVSAAVQSQMDINLTKMPTVTSEMTLNIVNVNQGKVISGSFQSKDLEIYPLAADLLPYPAGKVYENAINVDSGAGSMKFQCQHDAEDESCINGHFGTSEVIMKTVEGDDVYSFAYTSDDFNGTSHDVQNYKVVL